MRYEGAKPTMIAPAGTLAKKPPHGQPCNRCGLCCVATLCPLGEHLFKRHLGPCPALVEGEQSGCGVILDPAKYAPALTFVHGRKAMSDAAALLNGAGTGCDARFNGEPADEKFYAKLLEDDRKNRRRFVAARRLWGGP